MADVEGVADIVRELRRIGNAAEVVIGAATKHGAELVLSEIQRRAPEDTGNLRRSGFTIKPGSMTDQAANFVVTLSDRKYEYAFYLEFGSEGRERGGTLPAQPFIRPAFLAKRHAAQLAIVAALKRSLGL